MAVVACAKSIGVIGLGLGLVLLLLARRAGGGPANPLQPHGRVYLLRGQGWFFSGGWRPLRDRLRAAGLQADDLSDHAGDRAVDDLLADHRAGRLSGPIVFIGHSRGGRQSLFAAQRLGQVGIVVDLVLTIDVAIPPPVPAGVRRAVNLYLTRPRLYPARPLSPAPDSGAVIENIDLDDTGSPIDAKRLNHLTITDSAALQGYLFGRIREVIRNASS
jgi:hypothetical protein